MCTLSGAGGRLEGDDRTGSACTQPERIRTTGNGWSCPRGTLGRSTTEVAIDQLRNQHHQLAQVFLLPRCTLGRRPINVVVDADGDVTEEDAEPTRITRAFEVSARRQSVRQLFQLRRQPRPRLLLRQPLRLQQLQGHRLPHQLRRHSQSLRREWMLRTASSLRNTSTTDTIINSKFTYTSS